MKIAEEFEQVCLTRRPTESYLRKTLSELSESNGGERLEEVDTERFLLDWLDRSKSGKSKTTVIRYEGVTRRFLQFLDRDLPIEELTPRHIQQWVDSMKAEGLAPKSISNNFKILKIAFSEACRLQILPKNPTVGVEVDRAVSQRRVVFSPEEIGRLLETTAETEWSITIALGFFAAMSLADASGARWEWIHLDAGKITYTRTKMRRTGKEIVLPIHPELDRRLRAHQGRQSKGPLTPKLAATSTSTLDKEWHRILSAAEIEPIYGKYGVRNLLLNSFHALRHSVSSHLMNNGVPAEVRMLITGHEDEKVHAGYSHIRFDTLAASINRIPPIPVEMPTRSA